MDIYGLIYGSNLCYSNQMNILNRKKQKQLNDIHAKHPEPGDYWNEMLCGVCVVLEVRDNAVTIIRTKQHFPDETWSWDFNKVEYIPREEFKEWLEYDTIEGHWADVFPKQHQWAVDYFKEMAK